METIRQYLDSMFLSFPQTPEVLRMKQDLKNSMEEKYEDLKAEGKSENEAIGIVISEFGNIDELMNEMGMNFTKEEPQEETLSYEDALSYIALTRKLSSYIASGVFMIVFGTALVVLLGTFLEGTAIEGLSALPVLISIIPAVALFIYSGTKEENYKYIKKGYFSISSITRSRLQEDFSKIKLTETTGIIAGISIIITGVICVVISTVLGEKSVLIPLSAFVLLTLVAIGVFIIIRSSMPAGAMKQLLKIEDYAPTSKKAEKLISAVASVVWPLAVAAFLFMGFCYEAWAQAWIIFPIVGVCFGAFSAFVKTITTED